jgi:TPR repeat protein
MLTGKVCVLPAIRLRTFKAQPESAIVFRVSDEDQNRMRWKALFSVAILAGAMTSARAQTAGIDPALQAKAEAGDPVAQISLGESCVAARDLKQAADWYRKAATQGSVSGEMHLAALYRDGGKGFPRDMVQAVEWYRKAAMQGDVTAQGTLGVLYSFGQGVAQDYREAYFWLDLAASAKGPEQEKYAANRQLVGTHITTDELEEVQERVAKWKAAKK